MKEKKTKQKKIKSKLYDEIGVYLENKEYIANKYVMKCFSVMMLIYTVAFLLNILNIFIIDQSLMLQGYIPALVIYLLLYFLTKKVSLQNEKLKYFILLGLVLAVTIMGITITYHVIFAFLLPILCATIYSSKPLMKYIYALNVIATVLVVYGGYYFGLCDANMALLTTGKMEGYIVDGMFTSNMVNDNPIVTLFLYFVVPRCLIYIAYIFVCNSIFSIVSGSIEKAKLTAEIERAKEEAERAKEEAENANVAKTRFLAKMSHEIRTPINAVLGMNEMILRESKNPSVQKYANDVRESSMLLMSIINEILDSSKIESGKMEIVSAEYDISSLLNDLYNIIRVKAEERGIELVFNIAADIPCMYYGDDKRIEQILINLLTNGVKYTDKGTVTLTVTGQTEGNEAILHFSVADTGTGIREEDMASIYDAFQRIDMSRNRNVEGTGLGMNIVQQLLKLMGSELRIESEYGRGSEFSFDLVQKIINPEPLGDFQKRILRASERKTYQAGFVAPKARLLVVDDNVMNLEVFKALLKETQVQIVEAKSGRECLEILERETFDMIFMDHMMPGMDGIETLHEMKERDLCGDTPVVMLTANAILEDREKYIQEGFDAFLSKPIDSVRLEQMMMEYLPENLVEAGNESRQDMVQRDCMKIPSLDEFDFSYAMGILHDEETLWSILETFYHSLDALAEKLSELFISIESDASCAMYEIEVHGLKSSAGSVGALLLSKTARLLEMAAKNKETDKILVLHPILMEEIIKHKDRLATLFQKQENNSGKDVMPEKTEELEETEELEKLKESLEQYDFEQARRILDELREKGSGEKMETLTSELGQKMDSFDMEAALLVLQNFFAEA